METAIGFEFAPIARFGMRELVDFYNLVKGEYPEVEEQILFLAQEDQPLAASPVPRFWITRNDKADLVQIQRDRIYLNWRRLDGGTPYKRYPAQRAELYRIAGLLQNLIDEHDLQQPVPLWAEATYVNRIEFHGGRKPHDFFLLVTGAPQLPGVPTETRFQEVRAVADGAYEGRSTLTVEPFRDVNSSGAIMTIVTKVAPTEDSIVSSFQALDLARRISVESFAAATTDEMQTEWGRER
ncbi:TIGR04255 family protein [Sinomonas sp. P47F7]|uniref:TIGR04255 family protein n=1 Tax=Sinomonas sp. P47F7 TaxID=3410987 RepID=UPI003BF4DDF3